MLLHHAFIETAKSYVAFIDRTVGRELTYHRALIASLLLMRRFQRYDDDYLGIMLPTSAGCGLAMLATQMAGKVPVMINYSTGADRNCSYAQEKCGFTTIITSRKLLERIQCPQMEDMVFLEDLVAQAGSTEKAWAAAKAVLPGPLLKMVVAAGREDDTALILFTSGSEKAPKAVELTHQNIYSNVMMVAKAFDCTDQDRMLSVLPLFHVFGQTTTFWLPIVSGMTMVMLANPLEFKTVAGLIRDDKPTAVVATPYFLMGYLKHTKPGDFSGLRLVVAGADKLPDWLRQTFARDHNVNVLEGYGATETGPVVSANTFEANKPGSIGRPLAGVEVKIIDVDSGEEVATGEEGKIMVRSPSVMKGYLGDVEETALRIEGGWYETGDMGCVDEDGFLWHRGRLKRFMKVGGEMVSLVQVEEVVQEWLPKGVECCAVEIPDNKRGGSVGLALTVEVDNKKMLGDLGNKIPKLATPKHFCVMKELPKMGSGKIDFRATEMYVRKHLGHA